MRQFLAKLARRTPRSSPDISPHPTLLDEAAHRYRQIEDVAALGDLVPLQNCRLVDLDGPNDLLWQAEVMGERMVDEAGADTPATGTRPQDENKGAA